MFYDRRQFGAALAATIALPSLYARALQVHGVELGLQSYTFHDLHQGGLGAVDGMIVVMRKLGVDLVELWSPQAEPFPLPWGYWGRWVAGGNPGAQPPAKPTPEETKSRREALRAWREATPADYFPQIRRKFQDAGIRIFSYNYSFEPSMSDGEIDAGFVQAKALGVDLITASSRISAAKRVAPFAQKHNMRVAFHGHSEKDDPDQIAGPDSFRTVVAMSPLYRINLDVAHYAAAGFDAVAFLKDNHAKITNVHVHDRKGNNGESVPFGEGVAPTPQVLRMIRDNGWKIPVFYELEYVGRDGRGVTAETARELDYEKKILQS